jgi:hypothetical protein
VTTSNDNSDNTEKNGNNDLVWDLKTLTNRDRAHEFILKLENKLCVYSNSVEQLYTNYEILMPKDESHQLVILPNPYAYHDTYQGIPHEAIKATGLQIIPGKNGLLLIIPLKKGRNKFRSVPLVVGLKLINNRRPANKPLMPVLMKGDLRELNENYPTVHLHAITEAPLKHLSALDVAGIRQVISNRLEELTIANPKTNYEGAAPEDQNLFTSH